MQVTTAKLKALLGQSKGLDLWPFQERQRFIKNILGSSKDNQTKVFNILLKARNQMKKAEKDFQKMASKALDSFSNSVQKIKRSAVKRVQKQAEIRAKKAETAKMKNLLKNKK